MQVSLIVSLFLDTLYVDERVKRQMKTTHTHIRFTGQAMFTHMNPDRVIKQRLCTYAITQNKLSELIYARI
jgi:hypothetical protein